MTKSLSGLDFEGLIKRGAEKHGIALEWTPVKEEDSIVLRFSRGASFVKEIVLFDVNASSARSENGAPVCASDVVHWMRQKLESRR